MISAPSSPHVMGLRTFVCLRHASEASPVTHDLVSHLLLHPAALHRDDPAQSKISSQTKICLCSGQN